MTDYLKAEELGAFHWRVLAIPFGGQFKGGKDLQRDFFSPRTDIKADWFRERPVIWQHGMDEATEDVTLGVEDQPYKGDDGWWAEVWLDRGNRYARMVDQMIRAGKAFGSSGTLPHLVRRDRATGEILRWPHVEQTLTTTPVNFLSRVEAVKAVAHFDLAGISLDDEAKSRLLAPSNPADLRVGGDPSGDLPIDGDAARMRRLQQLHEAVRQLRNI